MKELKKTDKLIYNLILKEKKRQSEVLEMIPSENFVSPAVRQAIGSILTNKYSEGYPQKRYYGGNEIIDEIELLAINRAKKLFKVEHVNVQPYSGSPANLAVYLATCKPGDTVMGQALSAGGHLTHGFKVSATGIFFNAVQYGVMESPVNGDFFNYDEILKLAQAHKPKLIWVGATAYPLKFHYEKFAAIADKVGAYLAADISHIAGLIVAGVHPSPVPHVHIITTTTHKTLRGPRGAMIMVTAKGLKKDSDLPKKIDSAVFPGLGGGPHDHQTAAIAVALKEASSSDFKKYGKQIVKNAKVLAGELNKYGYNLVGGKTENHLILIDLTKEFGVGGGILAQEALDIAGITVNKNTIPGEKSSPFYPSGIRLGAPALTTRGMKEKEMKKIAFWINQVLNEVKNYRLPKDKNKIKRYLEIFKKDLSKNKTLFQIKNEIKHFCSKFPLP
jgi:glycine hydroxymethyltransferase